MICIFYKDITNSKLNYKNREVVGVALSSSSVSLVLTLSVS
jgi:hypothetical protein